MKIGNILSIIIIFFILSIPLRAGNPIVSGVSVSISGTTVTVSYNVSSTQSTVTIGMKVSTDYGVSWDYNYGAASGNIGSVTPGDGKQITWQYSGQQINVKVMITANDAQVGGDNCGTIIYEGQTYNTIMIGDKCWLKENLNVGTVIPLNQDQINNSPTNIIEKYCDYSIESYCNTVGGLYQWEEAMKYNTNGTQGICPDGWHIPSYSEFLMLKAALNNDGDALKETGQRGTPTNTSGFSAWFTGHRDTDGGLWWKTYFAFFWSSSSGLNASNYREMDLSYASNQLTVNTESNKMHGYSVRCIKN